MLDPATIGMAFEVAGRFVELRGMSVITFLILLFIVWYLRKIGDRTETTRNTVLSIEEGLRNQIKENKDCTKECIKEQEKEMYKELSKAKKENEAKFVKIHDCQGELEVSLAEVRQKVCGLHEMTSKIFDKIVLNKN